MDKPSLSPSLLPRERSGQASVKNDAFPWSSVAVMLGTIALTLGLAFIPADVIEQLGAYGYLGVFLLTLLASATLVLPSPAVGVALLAGKTLNPWAVGVLAGVAASLGEITGYIAGIGGNQLAQRSRFYPRVEHWVQRWGVLTIFILAAVPGPILDLAGLAAGAMRMPFGRFLIACMLGKTIRFIGVAWIGNLFL